LYLINPVISPDGSQIAAVSQEKQAIIIPATGGPPETIATSFMSEPLQWSADGKALFLRDLACFMPARIARYDLATGQSRTWKEINPHNQVGLAYFLNMLVGEDEKSYAYSYLRQLSELFVVDGWQ